jgi:hypothetical protein
VIGSGATVVGVAAVVGRGAARHASPCGAHLTSYGPQPLVESLEMRLALGSLMAIGALATFAGCGDDNETTVVDPAPAVSAGEEAVVPETEPMENEPPARTPAPGGPITIVPGQSIGPIRIGSTRDEVAALGVLSPHPQYSAMTIPYTVYYDDAGVVHQVEVTLMHAATDIDVGGTVIPRTATMGEAKTLLGDCVAAELAIGGTTSNCRDGGLQVIIGSGSPNEVWLRIPVAD